MTSHTKTTIIDPEKLRKQLNEVRKDGLAYSFEERIEGITAIAAPIFDMHSSVTGSLVVPTPTFRFTPKKKKTNIGKAANQKSESSGSWSGTISDMESRKVSAPSII